MRKREREPHFLVFFYDEPNYFVKIEKMMLSAQALLDKEMIKKGKQPIISKEQLVNKIKVEE